MVSILWWINRSVYFVFSKTWDRIPTAAFCIFNTSWECGPTSRCNRSPMHGRAQSTPPWSPHNKLSSRAYVTYNFLQNSVTCFIQDRLWDTASLKEFIDECELSKAALFTLFLFMHTLLAVNHSLASFRTVRDFKPSSFPIGIRGRCSCVVHKRNSLREEVSRRSLINIRDSSGPRI